MSKIRLTLRHSRTNPPCVDEREIEVIDTKKGDHVAFSVWVEGLFLGQIVVCDEEGGKGTAYYVCGRMEPLFTPSDSQLGGR